MVYSTNSGPDTDFFSRDIVPNEERNDRGELTYSLVISKMVMTATGLQVPSQEKRIKLYLGARVDETPRFEDVTVYGVDEDGDVVSYDTPLLDRPILEETGAPFADREEAMKTLEEYAGWIGISDSSTFTRDRFDELDRGIVEEVLPGQYL